MSTDVLPSFLEQIKDWARNRDIYAQRRGDDILVWDVGRLHRHAAEHETVEQVSLRRLNPTLATWFPDGVHVPLSALSSHIKRIDLADLAAPLLLGSNDRLIDGCHRYLRATLDGLDHLPCRRLSTMPPPDYRCHLRD